MCLLHRFPMASTFLGQVVERPTLPSRRRHRLLLRFFQLKLKLLEVDLVISLLLCCPRAVAIACASECQSMLRVP